MDQKPLTHEARRRCHGDDAWTDWRPCTKEQAEQRRMDETFQVRQRVTPAPAAHKRPPRMAGT